MKRKTFATAIFILGLSLLAFNQSSREELLKRVAVPSQNDLRGLVDIIGFAHTKGQIEYVVDYLEKVEKDEIFENQKKYGFNQKTSLIAGICPHDDYFYAGRGYIQLMKYMKAKRIVIFGVAHKAQTYNLHDRFIFDSFKNWRGPYGNIPVSSLREKILKRLDENDYILHNEFQTIEHSIEALLPFLQYFNRTVEIIPILVPYMKWERMDSLASRLASATAEIIEKNNWKLGEDIAFLISTDCVHYGDYGWGYYNYFPFGADPDGYKKGVEQDMYLISTYLSSNLEKEKIRDFFWKCVDRNDPYKYKITWCGRFSVPMGLDFLFQLGEILNQKAIYGAFLRYGTSLTFPAPPFQKINMGTTYYSNLHHWVGFTSIGYLLKEKN